MSPCRFSSSSFCRLNRPYFLEFRLFLLFSVFLLIELFEIKSPKWDTIFQTKVYGEGGKITPCVLHRAPSLTASVMHVWGFGGGMANWLMIKKLACDLLYVQHAFVQNCCGVISFLILHLNLVTPVFVFIPVELRSLCIRYFLWTLSWSA